ncbi:MAG: Holliday junction branch migration DNA helicase RuvB [Chloroflexi bacterium]|nr:Holliday junction branch migration DNA helicase RuvB [Chloroflexota bacterium]
MSERIVSPRLKEEDLAIDASLRPKRLADYIGQEKVKENLRILVDATRARGEALDHVLLYGPPGLGKTTLANIVANEMQVKIKVTSGPAILIPGDAASILTTMQKGDVFFIDEIHRLSRAVEETLYPAMEDFALDMVLGKGMAAKSIRLRLPHFTIIGATTRYALLSSPLRDRFGATYRLDFYDLPAMEKIVHRSARILNVSIEDAGSYEIARRSRGTPRVANRLLKRVRDFAEVRAGGVITEPVAIEALEMLEVDQLGLDDIDRRVLQAIVQKFDGGPVGIETIAACVSEESDTIMDVYEPFLLQLGFIIRTPRGRVATRAAYDHLGLPFKEKESSPQQFTLWDGSARQESSRQES